MDAIFLLAGAAVLVGFALAAAGRLPRVPQPTSEEYIQQLPANPTVAEIDALRLPVVARGYRMEEVDRTLTILRNKIAVLQQPTAFAPPEPTEPPTPPEPQ